MSGERREARRAEILRVTSTCNQRCVFCNAREDIPDATTADLEREVTRLAAEGVHQLVLSGGEPTLRADLAHVIGHARAQGIPEVELQTNAVLCAEGGRAAAYREAGLTHAFVALHAPTGELSDRLTGAPGTFTRSLGGIDALLAAGLEVTLNIVTNRLNYRALPDYVEFVARRFPGVPKVTFSFVMTGGDAARNAWVVPRMSQVAPYLRAAFAACERHGLRFTNPGCGVPVCFVPGYEDHSDEYRQLAGAANQELAEMDANAAEKRKTAVCADCVHEPRCLGAWKGYLDLHGEDELLPVTRREATPTAAPLPATRAPAAPRRRAQSASNVVVRLTLRCNERCVFCNVPTESDPAFRAPSTDEVKATLATLAAEDPTRELSFSGGEPTLRKDLEDLVAHARELGFERVQIQTNAHLLSASRAVALRAAGLTSAFVAYHSHVGEISDALTGVEGSAARTLAGIRAALKAGIPVTVNPVLSAPNLPGFPDFVDHVASEIPDIEVLCITLVQPHGRARQHPEILPRIEAAAGALQEGIRRAETHGIRTDTHFASLPLCHLPPAKVSEALEFQENRRLRALPVGEAPDEQNRLVASGKTHGPACARCVLKNFCNGVWRAYAAQHGTSELQPRRRSFPAWKLPSDALARDPGGPGALVLPVGHSCNSGCLVCTARGQTFPVDPDRLDAMIREGRTLGAEQVSFTGQEPTLLEELPELISVARDAGYQVVQLVTNGRRLAYARYAEGLVTAGLTELLVPLWGPSAEVHDKMTRVEGSFDQTLRGVARALQAARAAGGAFRDVAVELGVVVTRWNLASLAEIVPLAESLGVARLALIRQVAVEGIPGPEDEHAATAVDRTVTAATTAELSLSLVGFDTLDSPVVARWRETEAAREEAAPTLAPFALPHEEVT